MEIITNLLQIMLFNKTRIINGANNRLFITKANNSQITFHRANSNKTWWITKLKVFQTYKIVRLINKITMMIKSLPLVLYHIQHKTNHNNNNYYNNRSNNNKMFKINLSLFKISKIWKSPVIPILKINSNKIGWNKVIMDNDYLP